MKMCVNTHIYIYSLPKVIRTVYELASFLTLQPGGRLYVLPTMLVKQIICGNLLWGLGMLGVSVIMG